jgi:hypothetical protein
MRYEIWTLPGGEAALMEALDEEEAKECRELGMSRAASMEFAGAHKAKAQTWFIAWCEGKAGEKMTVESTPSSVIQKKALKSFIGGR